MSAKTPDAGAPEPVAARGSRLAAQLRALGPWFLVAAAFGASRAYFASLGMGPDVSTLDYFWQYQDAPELLRAPLETVFYQHTQPPLFNLYLYVGLSTPWPPEAFRAMALALGLVLHGSLYALARRLGVRDVIAVPMVWLFAFSPASILMELWVFYTHPVAAMVVAAAVLFHRGLSGSRSSLLGAFLLVALVALTRSLFHVGWVVLVIALAALFTRPGRRRHVLVLAALPLALVLAVYAKNWAVFGRPEVSTWLGFSLSRVTTTLAPRAFLRDLQRDGELSELATSRPWLPLNHYPADRRAVPEGLPDLPVLTSPMKSTGYPNFNHAAYVAISRAFLDDAKVVLARRPEIWRRAAARGWMLYFLPIHDYSFFHGTRRAAEPELREIERFYERLSGADAFADWPGWGTEFPPLNQRPAWGWAKVLAIALLAALAVALVDRRRADRATALFCVMTIAVVAVVGNSLELGENNRFRYLSEPLVWALIALTIERALRCLRWGGRLVLDLVQRLRELVAGRAAAQ